ncbi:hypothetical protein BD626DRAFT_508226 [Schizophyllum amplum]|uniref:Uncharacterized protein n=1 Tax=Schizophyllum amplum TaxID=97359 RepID=A0A550C3P5_9AGAR|nr:hypothetical protein BD626DRAFT_508226 [Auriculariopsis ampla]
MKFTPVVAASLAAVPAFCTPSASAPRRTPERTLPPQRPPFWRLQARWSATRTLTTSHPT